MADDSPIPASWPPGDSVMAGCIRSHDWAATPLGLPAAWPEGLRTGVILMLDIPVPACLLWGADPICFCNDFWHRQFPPQPGAEPGLPLRAVAGAFADQRAAIHARTLQSGVVMIDDQPIPVQRADGLHEAWWRIRMVPIRDADGQVQGGLGNFVETTVAVLARRETARITAALHTNKERHAFLLSLTDADHIANRALRMLVDELDLDLGFVATIHDAAADWIEVTGQHHRPGSLALAGGLRRSDLPAGLAEDCDQTLVCDDLGAEARPPGPVGRTNAAFRSLILVPLRRDGNPIWVLDVA